MNVRTVTRLVLAAVAALGALLGSAGTASAAYAPSPGTYYGNQCLNANRTLTNSVDGCWFLRSYNPGSNMTLAVGAYDSRADGYYAEAVIRVYQWVPGRDWVLTQTSARTANGHPYSVVGNYFTTYRISGATHVGVQLTTCVRTATALTNCATKFNYNQW